MLFTINRNEYYFRITLKLVAVLASLYGMIHDFNGLDSLTYFTYQSNIFISILLLIALSKDIKTIKMNEKTINSDLYYIVKLMATLSITVTLLVFAFILAPVMGGYYHAYFGMDQGASFCLHFLVPIIALIDFICFDDFNAKYSYSLAAIIPAVSYVFFVVIMGQCFGYRWSEMMAPYNFLNYGAPCGWFGFEPNTFSMTTIGIGVFYMVAILIVFFILLCMAVIFMNKRLHPHRSYK